MAFKKKLHQYHPDRPPEFIESHRTERKKRKEPADPKSLERGVRQLLADKVSGNMLGLWLMANAVFRGIDGDLRVSKDTILVTLDNVPFAERLRPPYEGLPEKLRTEHIDPHIPWLYDYKLDFRFQ